MADRLMDAYCPQCGEVRRHRLVDAGSCRCASCGHVEQLARPLDESPA